MIPPVSSRLSSLPPYLFVRLNAVKDRALAGGLSLIDLGMGNPDLPTPSHVVEELSRSARQEVWTHRYPQTKGLSELRQAVSRWYQKRFNVGLDPESEVLPLVGSKEGLAHLFFAYLDRGQSALIPSPCYPVHYNGVLLAGGRIRWMPLTEKNGFLPDLEKIPAGALKKARIMILNYPNNPTAAVVKDLDLFERAVRLAKKYGFIVAQDNAYSELQFDGYRAPSFLQVPGARKVGVEFHSFSKTYSMAGWRVAFVVGNREVVSQLAKFKSFLDYGIPGFIQKAAVAALEGPQDCVRDLVRTYQRRRDVLVGALNRIGWPVENPKATMYVWGRLPEKARKMGSLKFAEKLILKEGVVVAPGAGFGPYGEGYVRFALVAPEKELEEAGRRIGRFLDSL